MKVFCECNSFSCDAQIEAPIEELAQARSDKQVVLATTCQHGPEATDVLVSEHTGYKIYETHD